MFTQDSLSLLVQSVAPSAHAHHAPSLGVTLLFSALLAGLILCLAFEEKIHAQKSLIAGLFAVVSLGLGVAFDLLPFGPDAASKGAAPLTNAFGEVLYHPVFVQGVDWGVIGIILGASLFVDVASGSGLFTWVALKLTKASGGDPVKLLWSYGLMTVVFSAVLNNVTAMIIIGSLTVVSLEKLGKRELLLGFLLTEGLLTNVGGLLTLISSVPNIIVGTAAGISFGSFFVTAAPFVVVTSAGTIWLGVRRFGIKGLESDSERAEGAALVAQFDERESITDPAFFKFSAVMLGLFILTIASASALPGVNKLGMAFVALSFASVMLIKFKSEVSKFYAGVDWDLLGFFMALFVVINVMEHAQVLSLIGEGLKHIIGLGEQVGGGLMLVAAGVFSSVTDNIPLAAMLAKILGAQGTSGDSSLWWSVIFGANLGGNLTPIGSASTLVAVTMMNKQGLKVGFGRFVGLALPFALFHIALAVIYVVLFL